MSELKSNTEWKQWGRDDPLWGVATLQNKQRGGTSPWTEEEFYSMGESDWKDFSGQWQHYGVNRHSCIEIGCGAGRMTRQLANFFDHVYAVDVSEGMIERAKKAAGTNVEFSLIDGLSLPKSDCSVKSIFSTHVLQHLDSVEIGFLYFREFFRVLDAGGTLMIHVPLHMYPADGRVKGLMMMRGTSYPIPALEAYLARLGFKNIEFRIFRTKSDGGFHPFVFATK